LADLENTGPTDTVEHAANVFSDILKREAEAPAAAPEPEVKEPPSRFALPGKPEVEVEEPQEAPDEGVAGQEGNEPSTPTQNAQQQNAPAPDARAQQEIAQREAQAQAERNQAIQNLNNVVNQLAAAVAGEFADIKTYDDLERVATTDPDRYNRYVIQQGRLQQAQRVQQQVQAQAQQAQAQQFQAWQAKEAERLPELIPDLKDPEKAPAVARQLQDYALKNGVTPQMLTTASAAQLAILHKAMSYENYQAEQAKNAKAQAEALKAAQQKAANAPPVQKPGAQRTTSTKDDRIQSDYRRLRKDGSVESAAALFKSMGL